MINPLDLTDKRIIVTGASSGIGKATAIHLSKLGASVIMIARNKDKLQEVLLNLEGETHSIYSFDLKQIDRIEELVKQIISEGGAIHGFVHSAGIGSMRPLAMTKYEYLHDMMLINFYSFVEMIRCLSKKKNSVEGSSFIGVSSVSSLTGNKTRTAYCATKSAMDGAIRSMAKELEARKIRVNSVVPGWVATEMYDEYIEEQGYNQNSQLLMTRQYMGVVDTEGVANAIAYLLSDASRFITGTGFVVDGGYLS